MKYITRLIMVLQGNMKKWNINFCSKINVAILFGFLVAGFSSSHAAVLDNSVLMFDAGV